MTYNVFLHPSAKKQLDGLPSAARPRIEDMLRKLADDPRPAGSRKLTGIDSWRVRVGDYRLIYDIDDQKQRVSVGWIGLRKDAYKGN
jgi:mRNA interferase RelE/StbE